MAALNEKQKTLMFEKAVLTGTVENIKEKYDELGMIELPARSLGMACRFRGLEYVKTLVDRGFQFYYQQTPQLQSKYENGFTTAAGYRAYAEYALLLLDDCKCQRNVGIHKGYLDSQKKPLEKEYENLTVLPEEERGRIIEFLCDRDVVDPSFLLYYSIMSLSEFAIKILKARGVSIPWHLKEFLTKGGKGLDFDDYQNSLYRKDASTLKKQFEYWIGELNDDEKLIIYNTYAENNADMLFSEEVFNAIKDCADFSKIKKKNILELLIQKNNTEAISLLLNEGWINNKQLDELITFATNDGSTVAAAVLIDYKNKTVDLAKEQAEKENESEHELNLKTTSAEYLKKNWTSEKLADGTLRIKKYKGNDTLVQIPNKIGKAIVSTIGFKAFSPSGFNKSEPLEDHYNKDGDIKLWKITPEEAEVRRNISCVIIPDTIKTIELGAFYKCEKLKEFTIPNSVSNIGEYAFYGTAIEDLQIPNSIKELPRYSFANCSYLKAVDLGDGDLKVGYLAFDNCENLSDVIIRNNDIEIENHSFDNSKWLDGMEDGTIVAGKYEITTSTLNGSSWKNILTKE